MRKEFTRLIRSVVIAKFSVISSLLSVIASSFLIICFIGATILFTANFLHAVTVNVYPTGDTYIDSDNPDDNYAGSSTLSLWKWILTTETTEEIILLKFDLTNVVPTGSTVNTATLKLWPYAKSSTTPTVAAYKFSNNNWNPETVTWNTFTSGTYQQLSAVSIPYEDQYYSWNVVSAINNGILSLALRSTRTASGGEWALFSSVNCYDESERPFLTIDYLPPPVCSYTINSSSASYSASGGSGTVSVTVTDSRCSWTAVSNTSWITVTSGSNVTGNGTVVYTVVANTGASRAGTITIAGKTFTVYQNAAPCTFAINPTNASYTASGGSGSINVSVLTGASCSWTALSNVQWIKVTGGSSGTGNGIVTYDVLVKSEKLA